MTQGIWLPCPGATSASFTAKSIYTMEDLVKTADAAMYKSKQQGRNRATYLSSALRRPWRNNVMPMKLQELEERPGIRTPAFFYCGPMLQDSFEGNAAGACCRF